MMDTPMSPKMETKVSITVQDKKVCFNVSLKNSLYIQKPESLMCDPKTLPAPTASTINSGDTFPISTKGATIPAAVNPATVADPKVTLSKAVITHAKSKGDICNLLLNVAI